MRYSLAVQLAGGLLGIFFPVLLPALVITNYSQARNDRFASGYPSNPVPNTDSSFAGSGYDWSGVGWDASLPTRSVALLGPNFFLEANHYYLSSGAVLNFFPANAPNGSAPISRTVQAVSGGLGPTTSSDLCIGTLSSPLTASDHVAYYPILFLGYSSTPYLYRDTFVYGWTNSSSPVRVGMGKGTITSNVSGLYTPDYHSGYYFSYPYDPPADNVAQLVSGDSGSPSFFYSSATRELFLSGAHFAVGGGYNYDSALPLMLNYAENYMALTGYLPYVFTPPNVTWTGTSSDWGTAGNWSTGIMPVDTFSGSNVVDCASVLFDGASSGQRTISLGSATRMVTGLTFDSSSGNAAFTFSSGGTLQTGEAGIVNRDAAVQTFNCAMLLRSSQRWDGGSGGLSVSGTVSTGAASPGYLLVLDGSGNSQIAGAISGTGALSQNGAGVLTLTGANSYTGPTFILNGILQVGNGGSTGTLGTGKVTNSGLLSFNRSNDFNVTNLIAGSGILQKKGVGALTLTNANTYDGATSILAGTVKLANASALGSTAAGTSVSQNAALDLNGQSVGAENVSFVGSGPAGAGALVNTSTIAAASLSGTAQLTGNATIGGSGNLTLSGSLDLASHALTKSGTGTATLGGSQTWGNGASILVQAGMLTFDPPSGSLTSLGTASPNLTVNAGAAVNVDANPRDPFTDSVSSAIHVQIVNNSSAGLNFLSGNSRVAGISGSGKTSVSGSASLTTPSLTQNSLVIGGSKAAAPASAVPEPAALALLLSAAVLGLLFRLRRR
jgi:autotransporter-associated beta strand protein